MKRAIVAVTVFGLLGFARVTQAGPNLNNNFTAGVALSGGERETLLQLLDQSNMVFARSGATTAKVYHWDTGGMIRVDFTNPDSSTEQVYQIWAGGLPACSLPLVLPTAGVQYHYSSATDTCTQTALTVPRPSVGFFHNIVTQGTNQGSCHGGPNNNLGTKWHYQAPLGSDITATDVCVGSDNATPLYMTWAPFGADMQFDTFTAGVPAPALFCVPAACAGTPETHDTVVLPAAPLNVTIPAGKSAVSKTLRVRVRNADILPNPEKPGHTIQLVANGDCPAGTIVGLPDFGKAAAGPSDTVVVAGGTTRTAKVSLHIDRAAFTTFNGKAPARCTLVFTATTVSPASWFEPTLENNSVTVELNVNDKNDPAQSTTHESLIRSIAPATVTLKVGTTSKIKNVTPVVGNADILPTAEDPGDLITLTANDGDCPTGTVGIADYDHKTPGAQNFVTVKGGKRKAGTLPLTINASAFTTANAKSRSRCTALLTATGPSSPDPDPSNNATKLVIDVTDRNDF